MILRSEHCPDLRGTIVLLTLFIDLMYRSHIDKIPLRELEPSHMIEYHEQIHSLLLSHAHYSLALGQGSYVTYDFEGVEKQFMDQFIQSKPLIVAEHIRFEYTREARSDMFEQVRHRVKQVRHTHYTVDPRLSEYSTQRKRMKIIVDMSYFSLRNTLKIW